MERSQSSVLFSILIVSNYALFPRSELPWALHLAPDPYKTKSLTTEEIIPSSTLTVVASCIEFSALYLEMSSYAILPCEEQTQPISRTLQYRKVMKPMLERKRRARINRCLDELKELMVSALATDGENVSKLEKADILELTVGHLQKLKNQQRLSANPTIDADRFRAGFTTCAKEVSRYLASTPGVDVHLGTKLMTHLGYSLKKMDKVSPIILHVPSAYTPPASPNYEKVVQYSMPLTPSSSRNSPSPMDYSSENTEKSESVWRPW
ncbi:hypothetical protein NQ314_010774 [Rhamnusium bicolor]|uniref:Enhancer of split mgamma protein n=1 Tax=Rhamnusium bicolor TaxID=1586634 RepID=A0AAV8XMS9_9CUCU|nr:hypothetical protein NQ314_010774 [Rhamnusium bicolor]